MMYDAADPNQVIGRRVSRMIRSLVFGASIWILFLLPVVLHASPEEAQSPDQTDTAENADAAPSLDLFDEDTELTKKGWAQLYVSVGGLYLDADGIYSARLPDGETVPIIDFERAGLSETDYSYWLSVNWRSAKSNWGAWFGSWRYDVSGSRIWEDELDIGDNESIPVGASVSSEFDAQWYILEATYSFHRSDTLDTGVGFGVHMVDLDTTLTARIQAGNQQTEVVSKTLDTFAPLPNLLLYGHWKISPKLNLIGRVGYFSLDYGDYSGRMSNAHAMINYSITPRWALGLGYEFVDLDLAVDKTDHVLVYDIDFSGLMAFARLTF
jgi:hypothetical protein